MGTGGVAWVTQLVPFQRAATPMIVKERKLSSPTAVHEAADGHDTPISSVGTVLGTVWLVQVVPFHRQATRGSVPLPTAVHAAWDEHDTAFGSPVAGPDMAWAVHPVPFHHAANGTPPVVRSL